MSRYQKLLAARHVLIICALFSGALWMSPQTIFAQKESEQAAAATNAPKPPALTRTTTRHEVRRFAYGGTLTVVGAPAGSITIEAWPRNEIDISAEIELRANTEDDLARLAAVNGFLLDEDVNHLRILSTGTHDKAFMRRVAKNFPKNLLGLPWKIDYRIRVPPVTDLEIDAGRGAFSLTGVEGAIRLTALESDATMTLTGGKVRAIIGRGTLNVRLAARSWRGGSADIQLATGDLIVELPAGMNADINANILRTGLIESSYKTLEPREERAPLTPRSIRARTGAGGATLSFTVGDGTIRIRQVTSDK